MATKADIIMKLAKSLDVEVTLGAFPGLTKEMLAETLAEAAGAIGPKAELRLEPHAARKRAKKGPRLILHSDGASRGNPGEAGIGVLIEDEDGQVVGTVSRYLGQTTNNQAEYIALIEGLRAAHALGASSVELRADSELVVKQINGQYKVKNEELKPRHAEAMKALGLFSSHVVRYIPREQNREADRLANEAIDKKLK